MSAALCEYSSFQLDLHILKFYYTVVNSCFDLYCKRHVFHLF